MAHQDVHPLGPCDVTLLVNDGKEFKAHRHVLSEASPFFKNLLQSDMKENKEGIIHLETFTELLMKEILGFIYTGDVQILSEDQATELIMAGDFLFLPNLKTNAGRFLERSMTTSNCISTYYFAKTYRCDELAARATIFIQTNFAIVAKSEEFLNLASQEVEEWISNDEIVISEEENVFNIILEWIAKDQETRNEKFEELFRHVRLMFTSRDFLLKDIVTNVFIKRNKSCMNRVTQALEWIDNTSTYSEPPSPKSPRKAFESDVLVVYQWKNIACYLPDEDKWYQLPEICSAEYWDILPFNGKLYAIDCDFQFAELYDPVCNQWTSLESPNRLEFNDTYKHAQNYFPRCIRAGNGPLYAVMQENSHVPPKNQLVKFNITSYSWDAIQLLPVLFSVYPPGGLCIVASNKYIYVAGGHHGTGNHSLNAAARFDAENDTWEETAPMQEARASAFGAAANGKVYIAGGIEVMSVGEDLTVRELKSCEVYNELTNEWHFIASLTVPRFRGYMTCVAGTLYVLGGSIASSDGTVECYDKRQDKWYKKTSVPWSAELTCRRTNCKRHYEGCSARLFTGTLKRNFKPAKQPTQHCTVM